MIRVKPWLEAVSLYLRSGLLLYRFKSNHYWQQSGIGVDYRLYAPSAIPTHVLLNFFPWKLKRLTLSLMNICWAEFSRDLKISFKCGLEAIKNTTLCKLHKGTNGFRPMGSNADLLTYVAHTFSQLNRKLSLTFLIFWRNNIVEKSLHSVIERVSSLLCFYHPALFFDGRHFIAHK